MQFVDFSRVRKQLKWLPFQIVYKFRYWVKSIEEIGIREVRKRPSYHDEPLLGNRKGQRSVRLSRSYRIIYREIANDKIEIIEVLEVNKHEY